MTFPKSAGELLCHIERAGVADDWIIVTDPADGRDQCGSLRRTFRMRAFPDLEAGVVAEFGTLFVVIERHDSLLRDLFHPIPLSRVIETRAWACSWHIEFCRALELLFSEHANSNPKGE